MAVGIGAASCGDSATGRAPVLTPGSDTPSPPGSLPTSPPPTGPPTTPSDGGTKVRLVGVVVSTGDGYAVLRDGNQMRWTVTGEGVAAMDVGQRVQVTGMSRTDTMRAGHPLVVIGGDTTTPRGSW